VIITCPECGKQARGTPQHVGRTIPCPQCKRPFTVADPSAPAAFSPPFPSAAPPPPEQWYVKFTDGREIGPVSRDQMASAMRDGNIWSDCEVFRSDWADWKSATEVAGKLGIQLPPRDYSLTPSLAPTPDSYLRELGQSAPRTISPEKHRRYLIILGSIGGVYLLVPVLCLLIGIGNRDLTSGFVGMVGSIFPGGLAVGIGVFSIAAALYRWPVFFQGFFRTFARYRTDDDDAYAQYLIIRGSVPLVLGYILGFAAIGGTVALGERARAETKEAAAKGMTVAQTYEWRSLLWGYDSPADAVAYFNAKIAEEEAEAKEQDAAIAEETGARIWVRVEARETAKMKVRVFTERRDFMQRMATEYKSPPPTTVWVEEHKRVHAIYQALIDAHNKIANTTQPQNIVVEDNVRLEEKELREDYLEELNDILERY
jgi:hypothetical protein